MRHREKIRSIRCTQRAGNQFSLPTLEVWVTGDLHDHRRNLDKLLHAAKLSSNPSRHLILHEVIHGDYYDANVSAEGSWNTLYRIAPLRV